MNYSGDHGGRFSADGLAISTDIGSIYFDHETKAHAGVDAITIPDAHLLFSGDFKRVGLDLVLSNETQRYVVHDYFKGTKHASLQSVDGASLSAAVIDALSGYTVYAQAAPDAGGAGQIIGHVLKLSGSSTAVRNGVTIVLNIGDAVLKGDVIQTGSDSSVGITFIDGSAFGMNANARMVLNEMVYDPGGSSNSSLISLVQGTVTFVAGQTAKNGNMRVETPVATMGIRGTAVLVEIGADNGPTKFSVLVEPDGTTGSYNLYDNTTGQLIGTISQAGQVTLVTSNGNGPATYTQQAKTQADQQQEKALIQQVFQLYFPGYVPDAKPNSNKSGSNGSSSNSLANVTPSDKTTGGSTLGLLTIEVRTTTVDPKTGEKTTTSVVYTNTPAVFSTTPAFGGQNFVAPNDGFNIADHVSIYDPDIGTAPFFDVATPFVTGSAKFTQAVSSIPLPNGLDLFSLVHVDQTTGHVSYTPQTFNFLNDGETVVYTLEFDSQSGPTSAHLSFKFTVTGANDAPVFTVATVAVNVAEIGDHSATPQPAQTGQATIVSTPVSIAFSDADFTDLGANYHVAVTDVSVTTDAASRAGLPQNSADLKTALLSFFKFDQTTPVTKNLDETTGHIDGTFAATDQTFDYLADGQTLTIKYTVQITDPENASAVLTKDFTVTVTGSNDAPVLSADAGPHGITESAPANLTVDHGVSTLTTSGTLDFTDVDLIDTHTSVSPTATDSVVWLKSDHSSSGGTVPQLTLNALASALTTAVTTDSTNGATGQVTWTFKLPDGLADFLAKDETLTVKYTVNVQDGHSDGTVTRPVTIVITGTNDAPVAVADTDQGHVVEAGNNPDDTYFAGTPATSGNVLTNDTDVDINDTHSVVGVAAGTLSTALTSGVGMSVTGTYGSVVIHADGTWTYTLDNANPLTNALAAGQAVTDVFSYTESDNNGATSTTTLTIGITGSNDAPVTNSAPGAVPDANTTPVVAQGIGLGNVVIAGTATASGNVLSNDTDVDAGDTKTVQGVATGTTTTPLTGHVGTTVYGTYGSVTIASDGSWTYLLDNTKTSTQALQQGEHASDVFSYTMRDTAGATSSATLTIDVTGSNDVPVATNAATALAGNVKEDTTLTTSGQLSASDIDHNATQSWGIFDSVHNSVVTSLSAMYGSLAVDQTGKWTYTLANGTDGVAGPVQSLAAGEHHDETFTVRVTDDQGAYADQTVTVTVTGTNDAPVVTATNGTTTEQTGTANSGNDTATGTISFTDVDLTDRPTITAPFASYVYKNAAGTDVTASLTQEQKDAIAAVESALTLTPGANTNNGSATWTYTVADSKLDFLAAGEKLVLTYTATANDTNGGITTTPFTVTITGTNDAPVVTATNGTTTEQTGTANSGSDTATGTISFTDVDLTDRPTITAPFASYVYKNAAGTDVTASLTQEQKDAIAAVESALTLTPGANTNNGSATWTYTVADSKLDFLAAGEKLVLTYTATVNDGYTSATQPLTVTISGTNDAPVVTATNGTTTEQTGTANSGNDTATGTISFTDVDLTDRPTITAPFASYVYKNAAGSDVTASLTQEQKDAIAAVESTLTLTPGANTNNGSATWTYTVADSKLDFLAAGEKLVLTYTATVNDGYTSATQPLTVTISGTNDAPVVTATNGTTTEQTGTANSGNDTATGTISFTDVDLTDRPTITAPFASYVYKNAAGTDVTASLTQEQKDAIAAVESALTLTPGANTNNGSATWTYSVADSKLDFLAAGEKLVLTYTATVNDGYTSATQPLTVTITGTNDAPVIAVTNPAAVTEGNAGTSDPVTVTIASQVSITDVDISDVHTLYAGALAFDATHSTGPAPANATLASLFTLDTTNGTITYDKAAFDYLDAGDQVVAKFTFNASSGPDTIPQTIAITINGQNDAPAIVQGPETANVADGGTPFVTGQFFTATDPDHGDTATWTVEGGSRVASDSYQFAIDEFKVTKVVSGSSTAIFDDTFSGTAPPSGPDFASGQTPAGGPYKVTGGSFVADAANGLADINSAQAQFAGLSAAASTNGQPVFGQFATLQTNISSTSPNAGLRSGQTFAVSALFSNVTPATDAEAYGIRLSDRLLNSSGAAGAPPAQPGSQTVQLAIVRDPSGGSVVQFNEIDFTTNTSTALGSWNVDPAYASDEIRLTLAHDASANGQVQGIVELVNAGGTVDANYVFSATGQIFANENWTLPQFFGRSVATSSAAPTADSVYAGTYGTLDIDQTGNWSYALNDGLAATQALAAGETKQDVFHIDVTDSSNTVSTQTVTINVTGTNNAPEFSGNAISGAGAGYTEKGPAVGIVAQTPLLVRDVDNANFNGGLFSAAVTAGGHTGDTLSIGTTSHIKVDTNGYVLFDADGSGPTATFVPIGTLTANGSSLSVALNSSADAAAIMELTTAVQFSSTSSNPTADQRTVTFTLKDGSGTANGGHDTTSFSVPLNVTPVDDAPVAASYTFTNDMPPQAAAGWVLDSDNGHYYRYVSVGNGLTWTAAAAAVAQDNSNGYLASITSETEKNFVYSLFTSGRYTWLGGYSPDPTNKSSWYWSAGPEQGVQLNQTYTNWNPNTGDTNVNPEPNGFPGYNDAGLQIEPNGLWNDVPTRDFTSSGYVEEWGGQAGQIVFRENTGTTLTTQQLLANATDVDTPPASLSISAVDATSAHGGTVSLVGNIITYHPAANYYGADSFNYTLFDGSLTSTGTVSFNVNSPVPVALNDSVSAMANTATSGLGSTLQANDIGPSATIVSVADASHGTVALNGGDPIFTPDPGFTGTASFKYWISDATSPSAPGTFGSAQTYTGAVTSFAVSLADINGDHRLDLIENGNNTISTLLGNGDGTFQTANTFSAPASNSLLVTDLNGDGKQDIISTSGTADTASIWFGNGDGTFASSPVTLSAGSGAGAPTVADFNGDGRLDLAIDNYSDNTVGIFLQNANGTFQTQQTTSTVVSTPTTILVGDFNGDGKVDLALPSDTGNNLAVLLGNGDGTFHAQSTTYATGSRPDTAAVADLNGDGKLDIVVGNIIAGTVSVLFGNGDGSFQSPNGSSTYSVGQYITGLAIADVNQDGKQDVIVTKELSSSVSILLGNGDGTLQSPATHDAGVNLYNFAVGDLNGDGRPDIVAADTNSSNGAVFLNSPVSGNLGSATVTVNVVNHAPVIDTDAFTMSQTGNTTTIGNLSVSDVDTHPTSEVFTATAAASSGATVTPSSDSGNFAHLNSTLAAGVTYDPGTSTPATDKVTLSVSDGFGATDTVNFVFNQAGTGPVNLTGTNGKDVIFATGYQDTLTGGAGADHFVFAANSGSTVVQDTITDFQQGQDKIDLHLISTFGSNALNTLLASQQSASGDVLVHLTANNDLLVKNVAALTANDFIIHT